MERAGETPGHGGGACRGPGVPTPGPRLSQPRSRPQTNGQQGHATWSCPSDKSRPPGNLLSPATLTLRPPCGWGRSRDPVLALRNHPLIPTSYGGCFQQEPPRGRPR